MGAILTHRAQPHHRPLPREQRPARGQPNGRLNGFDANQPGPRSGCSALAACAVSRRTAAAPVGVFHLQKKSHLGGPSPFARVAGASNLRMARRDAGRLAPFGFPYSDCKSRGSRPTSAGHEHSGITGGLGRQLDDPADRPATSESDPRRDGLEMAGRPPTPDAQRVWHKPDLKRKLGSLVNLDVGLDAGRQRAMRRRALQG